jgi:hypothetical protein
MSIFGGGSTLQVVWTKTSSSPGKASKQAKKWPSLQTVVFKDLHCGDSSPSDVILMICFASKKKKLKPTGYW